MIPLSSAAETHTGDFTSLQRTLGREPHQFVGRIGCCRGDTKAQGKTFPQLVQHHHINNTGVNRQILLLPVVSFSPKEKPTITKATLRKIYHVMLARLYIEPSVQGHTRVRGYPPKWTDVSM